MYAVKRGLGALFNPTPQAIAHCASGWYYADPWCWATGNSQADFQRLALPAVGVPGVPTAEQLAGDPDVAVSDLVNAQAEAQQTANAAQVDSSVTDDVLGAAGAGVTAAENAAGAVVSSLPWLALSAVGVAVVVLYAMSGRRR